MKTKMKGLLFAAVAVTLMLSSCSKDQKVVKELEGTWNVTSWTTNGTQNIVTGVTGSYTWENCKVKKDDCDGTATVVIAGFSNTTSSYTYKIYDKGTKLNIDYADPDFTDLNAATITEHSDSRFTFSGTDTDGDAIVVTMTK